MNVTLAQVHSVIDELWPESTAESWDRVGLVVGDPTAEVRHIHLALDPTLAVVDEAVSREADLLLTHHPLLLRGIHSVAEDTAKGATVAKLIRGNCALIAAHTNADQPLDGVSDVLARVFGLEDLSPLVPGVDPQAGLGRVGRLPKPLTLRDFAAHIAAVIPPTVQGVRVAGEPEQRVTTVALCGGAGDSLLSHPKVRDADVYVTSDLRHHPASEAREDAINVAGPALIDIAHWAAESLWLTTAAQQLGERFPELTITVSELTTDPWDFAVGTHPSGRNRS